MVNETIIITKELGMLLAEIRKKAKLTQKEVGERLGFSGRSGIVYMSRLEKGKINNPSLWLILQFLFICEKPWASFFEKLSGIYFTKQHNKVMAQVPTSKLFKKVDRDVAKYTHSIDTKFARKQRIKPIEPKQKEKMVIDFGKYRAVIEQIEREITLFLGDSGEPYMLNQYYKAFAREIYSSIRKFTTKARKFESTKENTKDISCPPKAVSCSSWLELDKIIEKWIKKGLKREILEQIKEIPLKYFENIPKY